MKNRKRIASLLLAVTMLAALLAGPAVSAEKYTGSDTDLGLLELIGVYDTGEEQKMLSDEEVTRGEAVYYAVKLAGYEEQMQVYEPYYTDVPQENPYSGAITLAQNLKIISAADMFFPDDKVTADQLVRIVVSALGYDAFARLNGGYPIGYTKAANRVNMLTGFSAGGEAPVTYKQMSLLLNNALHSDIMEQVASGDNAEFRIRNDVSILNRAHDIYEKRGQIVQNEITSLNDTEGAGEDRVKIGDAVLKVDDRSLYAELSRCLGYEVTYYVKDDGVNTPLLVYFEIGTDNNITTIYSEDFIGFSNGQIQYEANGRVKTLSVPADANFIYNGKAVTEAFDNNLFDGCWGDLRLIRAGKSGQSILSVTAYENYVASAIDALNYVVYDKTTEGKMIDFKEEGNLSKHAYFRSKTGEALSFDKIAVDNVLSVAKSRDSDYFDVIVVTETVSGMLNSVYENTVNGVSQIDKVLIDANAYDVAPNMYGDRLAQLIPGNSYVFGLDAGGRIASLKEGKTLTGGMVFLIDAKIKESGFDSQVEFRVMSTNGKVSSIEGVSRVVVDEVRCTNSQEVLNLLSVDPKANHGPGNPVLSQPVQISINDEGRLTKIDTPNLGVGEDSKNSLQVICAEEKELRYKANPKMFESYFGINTATKVFFYPSGTAAEANKGADDAYGVAGTTYFTNDGTYTVKAYANESESPLATVVTVEGSKAAGISAQTYVMTVTEVCNTLDEEGSPVIALTGLYAGASTTLYLEDMDTLTVSADTGAKPVPGQETPSAEIDVALGDTIKFGQNNEGFVDEVNLLYDFSEQRAYVNNEEMEQQKEFQVVCGDLYQQKEGFISLCKDLNLTPNEDANPKRHFNSSGFKVYVVDQKANGDPEIKAGGISDLREYYTYGNDCSRVLLQMRYYDPRTMVIYQK